MPVWRNRLVEKVTKGSERTVLRREQIVAADN